MYIEISITIADIFNKCFYEIDSGNFFTSLCR